MAGENLNEKNNLAKNETFTKEEMSNLAAFFEILIEIDRDLKLKQKNHES